MSLAFCLGFRNWYPRHLQRCLASLRAHTTAPIVVADLGDDPSCVEDLVHPYGVQVVLAPRSEWSRSVALNVAASAAALFGEPDWLCFTDADMLFPRSWFRARLDLPEGKLPEGIWLTRSRDLDERAMVCLDHALTLMPGEALPPNVDAAPDVGHPLFDAWVRERSTPHGNDLGQGAAMLVPRAWFEKVGGFDEYYQVWGCEDNDLTCRAVWDGLAVQWLPDGERDAWVAHQWHRRDWPTPEQWGQVKRNREYFAERLRVNGPIVRNRKVVA